MTNRFSLPRIAHFGLLFVLLGSADHIAAADLPKGFVDKTISDAAGEHRYVVFLPENYDSAQKWPVILYLHGSGERGTDNRRQIYQGIGPAIQKNPERCPAIVLFPQAESKDLIPVNVWAPTAPDGARALAILDSALKEYSIDTDRIYLTGISMGGIGTWKHAVADPNRWAAIVPICGGGDSTQVDKIASLPIWCFHGTNDVTVPIGFSRVMIDSIKKAGGNPKFTEYPGVGHSSWRPAYDEPELWTWMLSQKRAR
jgi:predicted peptidase